MVLAEPESEFVGKLTLTYCQDRATRYPVGYHLGFDPPGYLSVMECLYQSILPKPMLPFLSHPWMAYGVPQTLATDRGPEFMGESLRQACLALNISHEEGPPHLPEFRATIERSFRTLNQQLIYELPGTTFATVKRRGDYQSEREACLTMKEIDQIIVKQLIDIYGQQWHGGIRGIPAERWQNLASEIPLPPSALELRIALGRCAERCVHHYGIELHGLLYNSTQLGPLRDRLHGEKTTIRFHPGDLGEIYVWDPQEERYLVIPAMKHDYARHLPLWQHQLLRHLTRKSENALELGQDKASIRATITEAKQRERRRPRTKATTLARVLNSPSSLSPQAPHVSSDLPDASEFGWFIIRR
jgi:putative transposase